MHHCVYDGLDLWDDNDNDNELQFPSPLMSMSITPVPEPEMHMNNIDNMDHIAYDQLIIYQI